MQLYIYVLCPIYQFVRYEMKTKRLVRVIPLKQIRKPKNRFDLKWLNDDADFIMWKYWEVNHSLQRDCLKTKNYYPIYLR